ncbi:maleylpyruvate isomerase N-terminal domain-containing protein, partial [Rhizobium leguminosarum]|uniref:maleylpyruvate isomerase N-terminal domain-containing protein n=1 Tax=Rhizobium leguminosarum TaxID=384 RepID=UPI003F9917C0
LPLFPVLDAKLIELLRSLSPDEWNKPTIARLWTVKDVATHLLDGNLRTLSLSRDKHIIHPDREINSYESLVDYLNQLNADWVKATKRLSPEMLIELLELSGKQYSQYLTTLDINADAIFSVAWAGEQTSKNWFHIAREYTEKW